MKLETLFVIQWNAHDRGIMVSPYSTMLEKNLAAYRSGQCSGFYPIAFARDRDHAEEVYNQVMAERDRLDQDIPIKNEERWLQ